MFTGNTGDPKTVASQVSKLKDRFAITRVVLVGDRGMLTAARLRDDIRPADLDWITALRAPQVKNLVRDGALQLSLSGEQDLAEITSPDYPGERLVACKNPPLEAERARKRESLLAATEADLAKITAATQRAGDCRGPPDRPSAFLAPFLPSARNSAARSFIAARCSALKPPDSVLAFFAGILGLPFLTLRGSASGRPSTERLGPTTPWRFSIPDRIGAQPGRLSSGPLH